MKMKRIFSLLLVIFLLSLYLVTFIFSFFTTKETSGLFFSCIFSTIVIPIILYGYQVLLKSISRRQDVPTEDILNKKKDSSKKK